MGRCILYTGIRLLLLIHPFISSFFFLSNFQTLKISSHFSQELWGLEGWNLVHTWTVGSCIVSTGIRQLLLINSFIFSVFFLSNFQTLKTFVAFFSGTVRPVELKLDTHVDIGWMYCVYRNQAAISYLSLISLFFFLCNVEKLHIFVTLFSGTVRPRKFKFGTLVNNGCIIYTRIRLLPLTCPFISSFFFLYNYQTLTFFITLFSELWGLESWNLVHMWTIGACIMYTGIRLLLLICPFVGPFVFLTNFQLQICLSPQITL